MLRIAMLCLLLLPTMARAQVDSAADQQAIRTVMDRLDDAWNRHDATAFAAVFAEDADFTNVLGISASGRSNIDQFHAKVFATVFKNSNLKHTDVKIRFTRTDIAAVDVHWEMTGALDPQGNTRPTRHGLLNFTMVKRDGQWQILVMHNTELGGAPPAGPPPVTK